MHLKSTRVLAVSVATLVLAPAATAEADLIDFRTPGKAAYCEVTYRGDIIEGGVPAPHTFLECWTPNDGFLVSMRQAGRPRKMTADQLVGARGRVRYVLRFGRTWRAAGFTCVSRSSGLTCRNRRGRGWWLGRYVGYRLF